MSQGILEHVNLTVADPKRTADQLVRLFGWKIRWEGPSMSGGHTVHVGTDDAYLAVYSPGDAEAPNQSNYAVKGGLNYVGVLVDDLEAAEARVTEAGFETFNHMDYEPGRRFYFNDADGIEFEVVSYA
ncbi:MAG: VOC family protein [Pseudomonadota bacterium]